MDFSARLETLVQLINKTAQDCGRPSSSIALIAVSKTQGAAKVRALYDAGQRDFGENYVQELKEKAEALKDLPDLRWHFIGHVQSNKIKTIVHYAASVHALSDLRHARLLANAAAAEKKAPFPVYLAVNAEGEAEKSGLEPGQVGITAHRISQECPELDLRGIMCVPPATYHDAAEGPVVVPKLYSELAALSRGVGRGELSLGMSSDLKMAIYAGATTVRIGSALFGARA